LNDTLRAHGLDQKRVSAERHRKPWDASRVIDKGLQSNGLNINRPNTSKQTQDGLCSPVPGTTVFTMAPFEYPGPVPHHAIVSKDWIRRGHSLLIYKYNVLRNTMKHKVKKNASGYIQVAGIDLRIDLGRVVADDEPLKFPFQSTDWIDKRRVVDVSP